MTVVCLQVLTNDMCACRYCHMTDVCLQVLSNDSCVSAGIV